MTIFFKDASSSDSELHRASPLWPPRPRSPPRIRAPIIPIDPSLSDSARSISSQEAEEAAKGAKSTRFNDKMFILVFLQLN